MRTDTNQIVIDLKKKKTFHALKGFLFIQTTKGGFERFSRLTASCCAYRTCLEMGKLTFPSFGLVKLNLQ